MRLQRLSAVTAWGLLRSPTSIPARSSHRLVSQSASVQMGVPQGYSLGLFVFPPQCTLSVKIASRLLMLYWLWVRKLWESQSMYFNYQHVLFFFACSQFITRNFRQHFTASKPTMSQEKAVRFRVIIVPVFGIWTVFSNQSYEVEVREPCSKGGDWFGKWSNIKMSTNSPEKTTWPLPHPQHANQ